MKFNIDSRIIKDFPGVKVAVIAATGMDNSGTTPSSVLEQIAAQIKVIREQYRGAVITEIPKIAMWRNAYRQFGSKPKDYPSSVESLYRRVLKGGGFNSINPVVDIYNYVSLKYMLTAGGEDTDKMEGGFMLTVAGADEVPVLVLGKSEESAPYEGEIIYKDDGGTICRRWNWREADRTKLEPTTKNCILVLEGLEAVELNELEAAATELASLIKTHCGGRTSQIIAAKDNPEVELFAD